MTLPETSVKVASPSPGGIGGVLARPQFTLLVIGQTVSQLGDRLHNMALIALVAAAAETATTGLEISKIEEHFGSLEQAIFGALDQPDI